MLLILVKNNLKIMLRDKLSMIIMIALPIILISVLAGAFSNALNKNYTIESSRVGYSVDAGSEIEKSLPAFINKFEENHIEFEKLNKQEAMDKINNEDISSFIEIGDDSYEIYKKEGSSISTTIFENSISSMMYIYDGNKTLINYLTGKGVILNIQGGSGESKSYVNIEKIDVEKAPTSTQYYGIVQIAYMIFFSMMPVSAIVSNERKYGVTRRIGISNASPLVLFWGKLIPSVITVSIQMGIATIATIVLLDVDWGKSPFLSAGILLLEIIATSSVAITLSTIFKSLSLVNIIIFFATFFFGLVGGANQVYMYNFVSDNIAKLSPLYYINRSLVEISTKGSSDYIMKCIILLLVISIVSMIIGTLITDKRREAL